MAIDPEARIEVVTFTPAALSKVFLPPMTGTSAGTDESTGYLDTSAIPTSRKFTSFPYVASYHTAEGTVATAQVSVSAANQHASAMSAFFDVHDRCVQAQTTATYNMMQVYNQLGKSRSAKISLATQMFIMECVYLRGVLVDFDTDVTILLHNGALLKIQHINKYTESGETSNRITSTDVGKQISFILNGKLNVLTDVYTSRAIGTVSGKSDAPANHDISPLALMWLGLLLYENDEKEDEEEAQAQARIQGFSNLGDNYEGKRQYCLTMQKILDGKINAVTQFETASGVVKTISGSGANLSIVITIDSGVDSTLTIDANAVSYLGIVAGVRLVYRDISSRCVPVKVIKVGLPDYVARFTQEKIMWNALGGNESQVWARQLSGTSNQGDVNRQYLSREFSERLQQYSQLGDDYLGKLEFASRMIALTPVNLANERTIWESLQADSAVAMKQKKKLVNAQSRQRE